MNMHLYAAGIVALACMTPVGRADATIVWAPLGTATNASVPSEWLRYEFDVTALIAGAGVARLSFDLRNDAPPSLYTPSSTVSTVEFGIDGTDYFARFAYSAGGNSSHWRDVQLALDGDLHRDQYAAQNVHLGDEFLGTAYQGAYPANNILGEVGPDAAIYRLTLAAVEVPEPATLLALGGALLGLGLGRRNNSPPEGHSAG